MQGGKGLLYSFVCFVIFFPPVVQESEVELTVSVF